MADLERIFVQFETQGSPVSITPFGSGHIHDSYRVTTAEEDLPDYLMQKVNSLVFRRVTSMMENIERVTQHMRNKLRKAGVADVHRSVLRVIPTSRGLSYYIDDQDQYWRMYLFIDNAYSFEKPENGEQAFEAGASLGRFQQHLIDLPGKKLHETIPHFHNMKRRFRSFNKVIKQDPVDRLKYVEEEVRFALRRKEEMNMITELGKGGFLPLRVTHNDTKFNNLLFDERGKALTWVDLDTVMPGYVHYDFGDAVRSLANTGKEDETDISNLSFNFSYYETFCEGYLGEMVSLLTPIELIHLAFSPKMMTFIMGLRFLTDFIAGDVYYKTSFPDQNLFRCRSQFSLLRQMDEAFEEMKRVVESGMF